MINISYLDKVFTMWELAFATSLPENVKRIRPFFDLEDGVEGCENAMWGAVNLLVETYDRSFVLDWMGSLETYESEETKEKAEAALLVFTEEYLTDELEIESNYINICDKIDFDKEDWKRKEE